MVIIPQNRPDHNKENTELRTLCSDAEQIKQIYTDATGSIKLKIARKQKQVSRILMMPRIVADVKIEMTLHKFSRDKNRLILKQSQQINFNKQAQSFVPVLSSQFDDSEYCLKTLLTKIDKMITTGNDLKCSINLFQNQTSPRNNTQKPSLLFFGNNHKQISEICYDRDPIKSKKELMGLKKAKGQLQQIQRSEPVFIKKCLTGDYGIGRNPGSSSNLKRKKYHNSSQGKDKNNSSREFKRISYSLTNRPEKMMEGKKKVNPKKEHFYQQAARMEKKIESGQKKGGRRGKKI